MDLGRDQLYSWSANFAKSAVFFSSFAAFASASCASLLKHWVYSRLELVPSHSSLATGETVVAVDCLLWPQPAKRTAMTIPPARLLTSRPPALAACCGRAAVALPRRHPTGWCRGRRSPAAR